MLRSTFAISLFALLAFLQCAFAAPMAIEERGLFTGDGTYFTPNTGACSGIHSSDNDLIAALNKPQWGVSKSYNGPYCGRKAKVTGPLGSVIVTIVDLCPECKYGALDLSPGAFKKIAKISQGRVSISWSWVTSGSKTTSTKSTSTSTKSSTPTHSLSGSLAEAALSLFNGDSNDSSDGSSDDGSSDGSSDGTSDGSSDDGSS